MRKNKKCIYIAVFLITIFIMTTILLHSTILIETRNVLNKENKANTVITENYNDVQNALREVANSYYMRGPNLQYNQRLFGLYSPEEATNHNRNYITCSQFIRNVYKELLGIKTPRFTMDLLKYSRENVGSPEVIAYGKKSDNNMVVKFYDKNESNHYKTINNPSLSDIIPYLKVGDILTFTGHTMLVYDLNYDENGQTIDAVMMHSSSFGYHVKTKIEEHGKFLFYNNKLNTQYGSSISEGSINLMQLSKRTEWININSESMKDEYSILRLIQKDENNNSVLVYKGAGYGDKDHSQETITLSDQVKDRLRYKKLYIEKTVNAYTDDIVEANDELIYKIVIRNNSAENYLEDIVITENISEYVDYNSNEVSKSNITFNEDKNNKKLEWNIGKLNSKEEIEIKYKVTVKGGYLGKTIESTGTVAHIPSATIKNKIGTNLSRNKAEIIKSKFDKLSSKYNGKKLINEIYKETTGENLNFENFNITDLIKNTDITSTEETTAVLNKDNVFYNCILNKYWNTMTKKTKQDNTVAYDLKYWTDFTDEDRRADVIYEENFKTGDILIYKNEDDNLYSISNNNIVKNPITYENGEYAYIFIEGRGFVGTNFGNDGIEGTKDDRNTFNYSYYNENGLSVYSKANETDEELLNYANYQTLLGKDYYVILRPSLGFKMNMIGDLNEDDAINLGDILMLLRQIAQANDSSVGKRHPEWKMNNEKIAHGDLNKNGKIDIGDILKICRYIAAKNSQEVADKNPSWLEL